MKQKRERKREHPIKFEDLVPRTEVRGGRKAVIFGMAEWSGDKSNRREER